MCQEIICCGGRAHPDFVSSHNGMETGSTKLPEFELFHGGRSLLERLWKIKLFNLHSKSPLL